MAASKPPSLTQANHVYLYQLLSTSLGCGNQTFITRVEEALESDRMTAEDLGFESTRDLLEELDEFVTLTVFKGGRIYATIIAQPAWDEALEQQTQGGGNAGAGGRPGRRGRAKTIKAVKPRRVKRETEPDGDATVGGVRTETAVPTANEAESARIEDVPAKEEPARSEDRAPEESGTDAGAPTASDAEDEPADASAADIRPILEGDGGHGPDATQAIPATDLAPGDAGHLEHVGEVRAVPATDTIPGRDAAHVNVPDEPSISLTVTYNPYEVDGGDGAIAAASGTARRAGRGELHAADARESHDTVTQTAPQEPRSAPVARPSAASPDTPPSAEALASYPREFPSEVYLPQELAGILTVALPFGESAMDALTRGFEAAKEDGMLRGNRTQVRFSFDLPESSLSCRVCLRRRSGGALSWTVASLEFAIE